MSRWRDFWYILLRNVFLLINGIIFAVVALLFVFGDIREGIFLGIIAVLNVAFGLFQDTRAWLALEKLQLLTAPRVIRVRANGTEESVLTEAIRKNDRLKVKIGDQIPCDSELLDSHGLEINEGLITGESNSVSKKVGDLLLAGSVVTAGLGMVRAETLFHESRIARMTEGIKKYSVAVSPIQQAVNRFISVTSYILAVVLVFLVGRGVWWHEPAVHLVLAVGTISSMLVPQGLVFIVTLFFAYGAAYLFKRHVLLQEVNATEKLGRIETLCMDKTGTLTENTLAVEQMLCWPGVSPEQAKALTAAYIHGSGESSQIIRAIETFIGDAAHGAIREAHAFSSWRQYGAVGTIYQGQEIVVLAGAAEVFLRHVPADQRSWLQNATSTHASHGKKMLCVVQLAAAKAPADLNGQALSVVALYVFHNNLRDGIQKTIHFFQKRGVSIRIISGDGAETVAAVARAADIQDTDKVITGSEMATWSTADFERRVGDYTIFASVTPEQKERIVEAFQLSGFTAMVGDGANDALAIKKADLGIAMFDGAVATRQLASVVLTNNSFAALPGGVALADSIIGNLEIYASLFINQTMLGFFFFVAMSVLGRSYPLTPFNITFINYFTFGIPGLLLIYWSVRPVVTISASASKPLLKRLVPFALWSAGLQTIGLLGLWYVSPAALQAADSNTLVVLGFIVFTLAFFMCAPGVYFAKLTRKQHQHIAIGCLAGLALLVLGFHVPLFTTFFNLRPLVLTIPGLLTVLWIMATVCAAQYALAVQLAKR